MRVECYVARKSVQEWVETGTRNGGEDKADESQAEHHEHDEQGLALRSPQQGQQAASKQQSGKDARLRFMPAVNLRGKARLPIQQQKITHSSLSRVTSRVQQLRDT